MVERGMFVLDNSGKRDSRAHHRPIRTGSRGWPRMRFHGADLADLVELAENADLARLDVLSRDDNEMWLDKKKEQLLLTFHLGAERTLEIRSALEGGGSVRGIAYDLGVAREQVRKVLRDIKRERIKEIKRAEQAADRAGLPEGDLEVYPDRQWHPLQGQGNQACCAAG